MNQTIHEIAGAAGRFPSLPSAVVFHADHELEVLVLERELDIGARVRRAAQLTRSCVRLLEAPDHQAFELQVAAQPPVLALCEIDSPERMGWLRDLAARCHAVGERRIQFVAVASDTRFALEAGATVADRRPAEAAPARLLTFSGPARRMLVDSYLYYSCASKAPLRRTMRTLSIA